MINQHCTDALPGLLNGDASRTDVLETEKHLRTCVDCQQELVAAVSAHAALSSARRFAGDLFPKPEPKSTPTSAIEAPDQTLPDISAVFAHAHQEAELPVVRRGGVRRRLGVAAAAAAVLTAGSLVVAHSIRGHSAMLQQARDVTLTSIGAGHAAARATLGEGRMRIDASTLPALDPDRQYEVWLVTSSGQQLRAVGYVGDDRTADLPVPATVLSRYKVVAISVQNTSQLAFSGDVVVSGTYA